MGPPAHPPSRPQSFPSRAATKPAAKPQPQQNNAYVAKDTSAKYRERQQQNNAYVAKPKQNNAYVTPVKSKQWGVGPYEPLVSRGNAPVRGHDRPKPPPWRPPPRLPQFQRQAVDPEGAAPAT